MSIQKNFGYFSIVVLTTILSMVLSGQCETQFRKREKTMATKKTSRNGKNQASGQWIRTDKRLAIYLRDRFLCMYCCRDLHGADPMDITLDHIRCQSRGGSNSETNLVTSCRSCNCSRQDKPLSRFAGKETIAHIRRNTRRSLAKYRKLAKAILSGEINHEDTTK